MGILLPYYHLYMNSIGKGFELRGEALGAYICLLAKEGKDPTVCSSFRPISLINEDMIIYARILAERIQLLMPELIGEDQAGFVPGRETRDNILKTVLLIHEAMKSKSPALFLSVDAEKAFDRLDWDFMIQTLYKFGIGPRMIKWIESLHQGRS